MQLPVPVLFLFIGTTAVAAGIAWLVTAWSYRTLIAARYWGAATAAAALGAAIAMLRDVLPPVVSTTLANGLLLMSGALCWAGVRRFQNRPRPWRAITLLVGGPVLLLGLFTVYVDDIAARIVILSAASIGIVGMTGLDLLDPRYGPRTAGVYLTAGATIAYAAAHLVRIVLTLLAVGGPMSFVGFNDVQAYLMLITIFGAQVWNAGFLLMAIDRLRHEVGELAVVDDLTGVSNRRRFFERARLECARSVRSGTALTLIALDLDRFKPINDTFGHAAGDACLQRFAALADGELRDQDMLARLGGDEFVVLLTDCTAEQASAIAEAILDRVRRERIAWKEVGLQFTASAGIAEWSPDIGGDAAELVARADHALYLSKQAGGDRVSLFSGAGSAPAPAAAT